MLPAGERRDRGVEVKELQHELEDSRQLWRKLRDENDRLAPFAKAAEKSSESGENQLCDPSLSPFCP